MIEAVLFDLDGLLINSEQFWQEVEYELFQKLGFEITPAIQESTYGLPIKELVEYYYKIKPWDNYDLNKIRYQIFDKVENKIQKYGKSLPGVNEVLEFFKNKSIKIGLASASPYGIIYTALDKLHIKNYFDVIHSGDEETYGKPHPAVFLKTAQRMNVKPINCIVFEDSLFGVIAAKAARMKVVAVPGNNIADNPKFAIADLQLNSLNDFAEKHFELLNSFN